MIDYRRVLGEVRCLRREFWRWYVSFALSVDEFCVSLWPFARMGSSAERGCWRIDLSSSKGNGLCGKAGADTWQGSNSLSPGLPSIREAIVSSVNQPTKATRSHYRTRYTR